MQRSILIIEDEAATLRYMQLALEKAGYRVLLAANGRKALEVLSKEVSAPNLIILDLMMPDMNGWQFLDSQRENSVWSNIPVIICSAYLESGRAIHPAAVVKKPIQIDELLAAVKSVLI
jgi:CheY-like chemotaxis protein